ncbi:MAG: ankyrin repeat domain-containing protein [Aestuariivita sp.]|nr:ankyrin repeat domain-containing protein [Aestuariivita sp.]MCY4202881.1 ankyrin repeat domain-containing protein [Aestuariivita sp.]MCY4289970.1 ankyrin repeat domain-containing protein [Aestuariivita sp.]MCY4346805.1 ankyrin repeat domain-containing protein [Aestuariivita sp.]
MTDESSLLHGTDLMQAVTNGDVEKVRELLQSAAVNAADADGWTPLHIAVHEQNREITRLLLEHPETDVNARNRWRSTPLMLAAGSGNLEIVESLLRHPLIMVDLQADYYGRTALIETAVNGHAHITRCLVNYGADINIADKTGRNTALIEAIKNNHSDVAIFLLRTGMVEFSNRDQRLQCLIWASRRGETLRKEMDNAIAKFFSRTGSLP